MPQIAMRRPRRDVHGEDYGMAAQIQLRIRELVKYCRLARLDTDDARAKFCGQSPSAWSRTVNGKQAPSREFIGGVLLAFQPFDVRFEDLFEVLDDGDDEKVPA